MRGLQTHTGAPTSSATDAPPLRVRNTPALLHQGLLRMGAAPAAATTSAATVRGQPVLHPACSALNAGKFAITIAPPRCVAPTTRPVAAAGLCPSIATRQHPALLFREDADMVITDWSSQAPRSRNPNHGPAPVPDALDVALAAGNERCGTGSGGWWLSASINNPQPPYQASTLPLWMRAAVAYVCTPPAPLSAGSKCLAYVDDPGIAAFAECHGYTVGGGSGQDNGPRSANALHAQPLSTLLRGVVPLLVPHEAARDAPHHHGHASAEQAFRMKRPRCEDTDHPADGAAAFDEASQVPAIHTEIHPDMGPWGCASSHITDTCGRGRSCWQQRDGEGLY